MKIELTKEYCYSTFISKVLTEKFTKAMNQ